jgi:Ca2+-binding EF-hand superfamily protein
MIVHRLFILACAALPFVVSEAAAQSASRYRAWDRNGDGVITRSEWRGSLAMFRDLDWNSDGVLSGDEMGDRVRRPADRSDDLTFADLDRNNDGRLSRGEWAGNRMTFRQLDRNGDNHISRGEFLNADVSLDDDNLDTTEFDALDYNNNGVIARSEWRSGYGNFNRYDANRDGVITRREFSMSETTRGGLERHTIRLDGRQPWTDTGIYVTAGDIVTLQADGNIQMSTNIEDRATPAGSVTGRNAQNSPRPDQRAGGLLARVGNSPVAFIGDNGSFVAQNSGELLLGINDDHFPDNSGAYRVSLTVQAR